MKLQNMAVRFAAIAAISAWGNASAQNSGLPELCDWYPGVPECSCNVNPYGAHCGSGGWPNTPDLRDGVTPPDPQIGVYHIPKQQGNPYSATCWSSSMDRYNYAQYEILQSVYNGDWGKMLHEPWADTWFFVVYSDNTLSEGYIQAPGYYPYGGPWEATIWQELYLGTCGRPPMPWQL